ncbi:hypothetical protein [Stieleria varia]|uniref:Uncharacterized protein n=1 Tax=Stieleria varia TaxID=2528005 RepID=A0A5C6B7D9_9BACT|nr:hypothetical protein [Stieleria varia]TWU08165.1 hypothetical protein Pla52n_07470 [Stieleria varia]
MLPNALSCFRFAGFLVPLVALGVSLNLASNIELAAQEMQQRPKVAVAKPFGELHLIDEIDTSKIAPVGQSPAETSRVETILGKECRVLPKTEGEASYMTYRIGKLKLLEPGLTYVLEIEFPEDAPRSWIIMNAGNETSSGFHTGSTFGDALYPKYVNNLNESLDIPLSGEYRTWTSFFHLHDRTPRGQFIRGDNKPREDTPEDGFTVTIAQFSKRNIPFSQGAAVSRIRLLAVPDPERLEARYRLPKGLPHRHLFWREEMSDGVVAGNESRRGVTDRLAWWRFKRDQMKFLGFNTFSKDLLEFGAVQHWDTTPHGGNDWAYFNSEQKDLWSQIVTVMGDAGLNVLPYYEYSGSKGAKGLGNQRLAKPLTRDDAYSHIKWIETSNADITDPKTYQDLQKMLDLTIVRHQNKANFVGAWLRSRGQMPMGFADATRERFAKEANGGVAVSRQELIDDPTLLKRYKLWWNGKRREFLMAMRDYLRSQGVADAQMLFTAEPAESGVPFPSWEKLVVADDPERLTPIQNLVADKPIVPTTVDEIRTSHRYLHALLAEPLNWGGWELNHRDPPSDPASYSEVDGVMMTHAFNRLYTVADSETLNAFRSETGLALIRHYTLNEDMMFDKNDAPLLGYFVADVERAGPFCMMAEAYAMANGDPTHLGYLSGNNFSRGFPQYVREFNSAFLSLPALPSTRLTDSSAHPGVVVRAIETDGQGVYLAVISLSKTALSNVQIRLPRAGKVVDATTGETLPRSGDSVGLSMFPFQLRALHLHGSSE